jgi:hypothetical protein
MTKSKKFVLQFYYSDGNYEGAEILPRVLSQDEMELIQTVLLLADGTIKNTKFTEVTEAEDVKE